MKKIKTLALTHIIPTIAEVIMDHLDHLVDLGVVVMVDLVVDSNNQIEVEVEARD